MNGLTPENCKLGAQLWGWFPENKMFGWLSVQGPNIWIIQSNKALVTSETYPGKIFSQSDDHCHLMIMLRYNDSDFSYNW